MTLPSPAAITAIGTAIGLAALGVGFLLKDLRLAIELGAVAAFVLLIAGAAAGYKSEGRTEGKAEVQAKFDAYLAKEAKVVADTTAAWTKAVNDADASAKEAIAQMKDYADGLDAQVARLKRRDVVLSADLSNLLQYAGRANPTAADPGSNTGGQDASVAIPRSTETQTFDESDLGKFIADGRKAYDSCHVAWSACVTQYDGIRAGVQPTKGK